MKFSIITPSYNSGKFIAETIESVISQEGHFSIEYIILDSLSTDGSKEIVESYKKKLENLEIPLKCLECKIHLISEKDLGMYDAINKGFEAATGDTYAWINADDIYLPGAFETMNRVFSEYQDISWAKGITNYIDESSTLINTGKCWTYHQDWIQKGIYGRELHFIQQDSVFWKAGLWKKSGGINASYRLAGDYDLWIKFSYFSKLVSVNVPVSCFRHVQGQLSSNLEAYRKEMKKISPKISILLKAFQKFKNFLPSLAILFQAKKAEWIVFNHKGQLVKKNGSINEIVK